MAVDCPASIGTGASTAHGASTENESIAVQHHGEVQNEKHVFISAFEVMRSRVRNDGSLSTGVSGVSNWIDERTRASLLSEIKSVEGVCGNHSTDQGLPERALLDMKQANDLSGKRDVRHHSYRISDHVSYDGSPDFEMKQTSSRIGDDIPRDIKMPSVSREPAVSSAEPLGVNRRQAEFTGDNFVTHEKILWSPFWTYVGMEHDLQLEVEAFDAMEGKWDDEEFVLGISDPLSWCGLDPSFSVPCSDILTLEGRAKRTRSRNWSPEETRAFLEMKVEALEVVKGKEWDFISQSLRERHGFERSSKCCEVLWGTLLKRFSAIRSHETGFEESQKEWVSYWKMDGDAKSKNRLPRWFPQEWYKMLEGILEERGKRSRSTDHPAGPSNAKHDGRKVLNYQVFKRGLVPLVKQQVEDAVNFVFENYLPCEKTSGSSSEQSELSASMAPLVKQQVEAGVIFQLKILTLAGFKDDPVTGLPPGIGIHIKDALNFALQPVFSALQALKPKEQEYQLRLEARDKLRRALDLKRIKIRSKCVERYQSRHQRVLKDVRASGGRISSQKAYPRIERIEHPKGSETSLTWQTDTKQQCVH